MENQETTTAAKKKSPLRFIILGIILLVAAGVLFATTLIGFCPLYAMLGISSCKEKKTGSAV